MNFKIRNKFIEIENSICDWFIIFVTNMRRFRVLEVRRYIDCDTDLSWNILGKSIKSIPL